MEQTMGNPCKLCAPGTYVNTTNATACLPCPAGTFINVYGADTCYQCPFGSLNNSTGSMNQSNCVPSLWIVRLVVPNLHWTQEQLRVGFLTIARGLNIPVQRVSVFSQENSGRLPSTATTIDVGCVNEADAYAILATLTRPWLENLFKDSGIPPPVDFISVNVITNTPVQTPTAQIPTQTHTKTILTTPMPNPIPTPKPADSGGGSTVGIIVGSAVGGVCVLTVLGMISYFQLRPTMQLGAKIDRARTSLAHRIRVRITSRDL